jgi:hypothetical protein
MRAFGYNSELSSTRTSGAPVVLSLLTMAVLVAACGGGGGGSSEPPVSGGVAEQPQDGGDSTGPAPHDGPEALYFRPAAALAAAGAVDQLSGGAKLFAAWNPNDANSALKPGMKVMFFGSAQGCAPGTQGPLIGLSDSRLAKIAALTSLPYAAAAQSLRWTPAAASAGCDAEAQGRDGASAVFLNADDSAGAVGMLTTSGKQDDGKAPFFGPFGAGGQNGAGTNAYITGTFVNLRQAWSAADPLQPWTGSAMARVRTVQSLGAVQLDTAGPAVQAKQQMMATFLNTASGSHARCSTFSTRPLPVPGSATGRRSAGSRTATCGSIRRRAASPSSTVPSMRADR